MDSGALSRRYFEIGSNTNFGTKQIIVVFLTKKLFRAFDDAVCVDSGGI